MRRVLICLLCAVIGVGVGKLASSFGRSDDEKPAKRFSMPDIHGDKARTQREPEPAAGAGAAGPRRSTEPAPAVLEKPADRLRVLGYVVRGRHVNVALSDGRVVTERDGLTFVARNAVIFEGQKLYLQAPRERVPAPQISTPAPEVPASLASPPTPPESASSWRTDSDGVQRLTQKEELAKSSFSMR